MEQSYKNCQSCGMPLKKDEKGGELMLPIKVSVLETIL